MKFDESMIQGSIEPGFEKAKDTFIENFKRPLKNLKKKILLSKGINIFE